MKLRSFRHLPLYAVLIIFAGFSLFPIYYTIISSFKTNADFLHNMLFLPSPFTLENFEYSLFKGKIYKYFFNNLIIIPPSLILYLFTCTAAGFAFGKLRFRFKHSIFLFIMFVMSFPQMVLSLQIVKICNTLNLTNTIPGIILVWVAYFAPFGTYMMSTYFSTIPDSIIEAARIDGANIFLILFRIMIPVAAPMMATITVVGFQAMWNELSFSLLLLQDMGKRTMTLGLAMMQGEYGLPDNIITAAIFLTALVPLSLFVVMQKNINMGVTAGSVKE